MTAGFFCVRIVYFSTVYYLCKFLLLGIIALEIYFILKNYAYKKSDCGINCCSYGNCGM